MRATIKERLLKASIEGYIHSRNIGWKNTAQKLMVKCFEQIRELEYAVPRDYYKALQRCGYARAIMKEGISKHDALKLTTIIKIIEIACQEVIQLKLDLSKGKND